jgi:hypothetical protein
VVLPPVSHFAQNLDYKQLTWGPVLQNIAFKWFIGKILKTNGYWAFWASESTVTSIAFGDGGIGRWMLLICLGLESQRG